MKICFTGLENQIVLSGAHVSVLQINNKTLFAEFANRFFLAKEQRQ